MQSSRIDKKNYTLNNREKSVKAWMDRLNVKMLDEIYVDNEHFKVRKANNNKIASENEMKVYDYIRLFGFTKQTDKIKTNNEHYILNERKNVENEKTVKSWMNILNVKTSDTIYVDTRSSKVRKANNNKIEPEIEMTVYDYIRLFGFTKQTDKIKVNEGNFIVNKVGSNLKDSNENNIIFDKLNREKQSIEKIQENWIKNQNNGFRPSNNRDDEYKGEVEVVTKTTRNKRASRVNAKSKPNQLSDKKNISSALTGTQLLSKDCNDEANITNNISNIAFNATPFFSNNFFDDVNFNNNTNNTNDVSDIAFNEILHLSEDFFDDVIFNDYAINSNDIQSGYTNTGHFSQNQDTFFNLNIHKKDNQNSQQRNNQNRKKRGSNSGNLGVNRNLSPRKRPK